MSGQEYSTPYRLHTATWLAKRTWRADSLHQGKTTCDVLSRSNVRAHWRRAHDRRYVGPLALGGQRGRAAVTYVLLTRAHYTWPRHEKRPAVAMALSAHREEEVW